MVGAHAIIKNSCQGNNGSPREVFKYGAFNFVGPRGLSAFQQLDVRFHLVRKNLDDERVVFREEAEQMVGGVATEVVDASYRRNGGRWGLGGFVRGFRRSNSLFRGRCL
jgi:hypothetical protein